MDKAKNEADRWMAGSAMMMLMMMDCKDILWKKNLNYFLRLSLLLLFVMKGNVGRQLCGLGGVQFMSQIAYDELQIYKLKCRLIPTIFS